MSQEAGSATLAAELFAVFQGADYIRTHDPAALADGLAVWNAGNIGSLNVMERFRNYLLDLQDLIIGSGAFGR